MSLGAERQDVILGVEWVALPTHDLVAAMRFYGDVLGLELTMHHEDRHWAEFEAGNLTIGLFDAQATGLQHNVSLNPIAFKVEDVDAARAVLEGRGLTFDAQTLDTGRSRFVTFRDPDGNTLMLHARYT